MKKGSITVYLSLILLVMISFFTAIIQGARTNATLIKMQCSMDLAIDSCLAEYQIPLLEKYGLFFIDTAYGKSSGSYPNTASHMEEYLMKNIDALYEAKDSDTLQAVQNAMVKDWYGIEIENVTLTEGYYATDQNGEVLRQQAIDYMYQYYGITAAEELINGISGDILTVSSQGWDKEDTSIEDSLSEYQGELEEYQGQEEVPEQNKQNLKEGEEPKSEKIETSDPTQGLVNHNQSLLLNTILKQNAASVSSKAIDQKYYLSHRGIANQGETPAYQADVLGDLSNEIMYNEYILLMCDSYDLQETGKLLEYEVEYILGGKSSDKENLQYVARRILLMRQSANLLALLADPVKMGLIDTAATTFSAGFAVLIPVYKVLFTFGWTYIESIQDMEDLLAGKKVPLLKDTTTWKTDLDNLLFGKNQVKSVDVGLDYHDYLRILLVFEDETVKNYRLMDIMEMNVKLEEGYQNFQMDNLIEGFEVQVSFHSSVGSKTFTKKREYDTGPIFRN